VGSANGDRSQNRRKKRRGEQPLTPTAAGAMLSEARVRLGIELSEVHDRTGISLRNLEALESGEVQHFSDPSAAAVAMRRYADLVDLDPEPLIGSLASPELALAGAPSVGSRAIGSRATGSRATGSRATGSRTGGNRAVGAPSTGSSLVGSAPSWGPAPASDQDGHLRRFYGDQSHLHSFTQTAEVPAVGRGGGPGLAGGYVPPRRRRKAPLGLRLLTWLVLILLIAGGAGLGVYPYKPQWLRDIHVLRDDGRVTASGKTHTKTTTAPTTSTTEPPVVTSQAAGVGIVNVKVGAANYSVVVSTFNWCWVKASTSLSANPLLNQTLQPGQTASIPVSGTPVTLELGSLAALIKVKIGGQTVATWSLRPNAVPFQVNFTSS
jgi:hypothetical protein